MFPLSLGFPHPRTQHAVLVTPEMVPGAWLRELQHAPITGVHLGLSPVSLSLYRLAQILLICLRATPAKSLIAKQCWTTLQADVRTQPLHATSESGDHTCADLPSSLCSDSEARQPLLWQQHFPRRQPSLPKLDSSKCKLCVQAEDATTARLQTTRPGKDGLTFGPS